jgi:hypothetical protein
MSHIGKNMACKRTRTQQMPAPRTQSMQQAAGDMADASSVKRSAKRSANLHFLLKEALLPRPLGLELLLFLHLEAVHDVQSLHLLWTAKK